MLMRFLAILALAVAVAAPVNAQVEFGHHEQFQSRFGMLSVVDQGNDEVILFNGQQIALQPDYIYAILGAWGLANADHDWVLVQGFHGGNMCGRGVTVLRVSAIGVTVAGELGECTFRPHDIRVLPGALEFDTWEDTFEVDYITYRFDAAGASATRNIGDFSGSAMAGSGPDVTRWVGLHLGEVVEDAGERTRFLAIMSQEDLRQLTAQISVGGFFERQGDWLLAAGCQPHACNAAGAVVGIRISTGEPRVVLWHIESDGWLGSEFFGDTSHDPVWGEWIVRNNAAL